ncbi:hypothetical protein GCM10010140_10090 [Streptosporangium pseudovulgare]|uniref:RNA polymerase alpha subunit C-terminal domain-containing protein n=1 Tax=Streptosporangium pseudovulgare TaxID=35765 RepID=A0ABQ2QIB0_9ACTN|nr:hypothetical protein GCM10010140_10090 [Streptosporangium pseudovulgare]
MLGRAARPSEITQGGEELDGRPDTESREKPNTHREAGPRLDLVSLNSNERRNVRSIRSKRARTEFLHLKVRQRQDLQLLSRSRFRRLRDLGTATARSIET